MNFRFLIFLLLPILATAQEKPPAKLIHVIVALCDNESQGIMPVNARIGNGDDLHNNLYWGCSDGFGRFFKNSKEWELTKTETADVPDAEVLQRLTFVHNKTGAMLLAEAWRGREIRKATEHLFHLLESDGGPDLVAYIGHNGLMDFVLDSRNSVKPDETRNKKSAIVLCCKSDAFFSARLKRAEVEPVLMTDQLMYPGSFLLKAALEGWLRKEKPDEIRERAARAYATNQKISTKAARGIFTKIE
ncbi:MAG: hypothetical protein HKN23_15805 [Verrucomicrobiales bacterium]|nr:hypothetical protein [Verrucomicrobiales bacterium]